MSRLIDINSLLASTIYCLNKKRRVTVTQKIAFLQMSLLTFNRNLRSLAFLFYIPTVTQYVSL